MEAIARVQTYLRHKATSSLGCHSCTPFSVFTHPGEKTPSFAIPDVPVDKAIDQVVTELQVYAAARHIPARVRCIEEYTPEFVAALRKSGFGEVWRQPIMTVTPTTLNSPDPIPGLNFVVLSSDSRAEDLREGWIANARGFGEEPDSSDREIERFRRSLTSGRAVTARMNGEPAAAGMFTDIRKNATELVGISTLPEFRRQGIAGSLTAKLARTAFENGADLFFLTTESPDAVRIYERIGFRVEGWLIEMSDNQAEWTAPVA
jgi:ribosomal protein S18 acetylase RimI-like enzyme